MCRIVHLRIYGPTHLIRLFRKTKRHTVTELLEGGDDEPMADPDEAMDEFPFELEGDGGAKGKTGRFQGLGVLGFTGLGCKALKFMG